MQWTSDGSDQTSSQLVVNDVRYFFVWFFTCYLSIDRRSDADMISERERRTTLFRYFFLRINRSAISFIHSFIQPISEDGWQRFFHAVQHPIYRHWLFRMAFEREEPSNESFVFYRTSDRPGLWSHVSFSDKTIAFPLFIFDGSGYAEVYSSSDSQQLISERWYYMDANYLIDFLFGDLGGTSRTTGTLTSDLYHTIDYRLDDALHRYWTSELVRKGKLLGMPLLETRAALPDCPVPCLDQLLEQIRSNSPTDNFHESICWSPWHPRYVSP